MTGNITDKYPEEALREDHDDGTMPENVQHLREHVVGHKIIKAERVAIDPRARSSASSTALEITLNNGKRVQLVETNDCCAYTEVEDFLLNAEHVDHVITGVGTTEGYDKWHIYADFGDILELDVGWSSGNPFYYGYGFDIAVIDSGKEAS